LLHLKRKKHRLKTPMSKSKPKPSPTVYDPNSPPEEVTPENPLFGLETRVLKTWLENSPSLRRHYHQSPEKKLDLENAVRQSVNLAFGQELLLRAQGKTQEEAEEQTRPLMWTPPTWPTIPRSPSRKLEENDLETSS